MNSSPIHRLRNRVLSYSPVARLGSRAVAFLARLFRLDLLHMAHAQRGILCHENFEVSGENHLVRQWLPRFLESCSVQSPVFFDVGANVGDYSRLLAETFPQGNVQSFEPLPSTYAVLQRSVAANANIHPWNLAMSNQEGSLELWAEPDKPEAIGHTTIYRDVLTTQFHYDNIVSTKIPAKTLDGFCQEHAITDIHLLKIDTEGHELEVLRGAAAMLEQKHIFAVQFEFNEMHIISRVFLRDFVQLFADFNLYRLVAAQLLPFTYSSREEIFLVQNLLAVRKDLDKTLSSDSTTRHSS